MMYSVISIYVSVDGYAHKLAQYSSQYSSQYNLNDIEMWTNERIQEFWQANPHFAGCNVEIYTNFFDTEEAFQLFLQRGY